MAHSGIIVCTIDVVSVHDLSALHAEAVTLLSAPYVCDSCSL